MADAARPTPLVVANWKMNLTPTEAVAYADRFVGLMEPQRSALGAHLDVAIAPAHPALECLARSLADSGIGLAAQNLHAEESGAFTGEVSRAMLEDLGCEYVLIGHSERRQLFGEDDTTIAAKAKRLVGSSLRAILCVGETLEERDAEATLAVVERQLAAVLDATGTDLVGADGPSGGLVVAYEPVWAIGTGRTATPDMAQEVHAAIRKTLIARFGEAGRATRILYGGSVKPSNAGELLSQPDIDGALVGGASLDPDSFAQIALAPLARASMESSS